MSTLAWKDNWESTRAGFADWWSQKGVLIGSWDFPVRRGEAIESIDCPGGSGELASLFDKPRLRAEWNHYNLSRHDFPESVLPIADTDIGPGSLCLFLGATALIEDDTVWFEPCWEEVEDVDEIGPIHFNPDSHWWKITESTLRECVRLGDGKYLTGCPDLVENVDTLASLREPQNLLLDMLESPQWVEQKLQEATTAWIGAYGRIYDIIKLDDGSSAYGAFRLWGPGKVAKVQCDASAMFSEDMFRKFVVPELQRQCEWLDHSLYHLDGTQAVRHLDALLALEALDAIEWTPQAGIETGGNARWFPMYRRILEAGKSLQVVNVLEHEVKPLLNAIGTEGIYILREDLKDSSP
ncbi:MAG: hypothetical protein AB3N64_10435 [Puniceicoccaceae bacterium]